MVRVDVKETDRANILVAMAITMILDLNPVSIEGWTRSLGIK